MWRVVVSCFEPRALLCCGVVRWMYINIAALWGVLGGAKISVV